MPLLIDTDIGTDPDDLQVLMMAGALGLDLVGITTVYGDTDLRARLAAAMAPLVGLACPIVAGRREPLSGREVVWAGHEGEDVPGIGAATYRDDLSAPRFISEAVASHHGAIDVLTIGPLTNLAVALLADPDLAGGIRHLYAMGGDFSAGSGPEAGIEAEVASGVTIGIEHNASADALATWIVLRSGVPMTMSGFDITRRVVLSAEDHARIERSGEAGRILEAATRRFLDFVAGFELEVFGRGHIPHDPIALLTRERPELFSFESCRVDVVGVGRDSGRIRATPDPRGNVRVVRDLDVDLVRRTIVDLLAQV